MASARELYEDWKASGDTQREVAERHGMNPNTVRGKIGEYQREMKAMEDADDDADDDAPEEAAPDATDARLRRFLDEQGVEDTAIIGGAWVKDEGLSVYVKMPVGGPSLDEVMERHIARIKEVAPVYQVPTMAGGGEYVAIPQVYDLHLGKLSVDETYTLSRQVDDYLLAIDGMLAFIKQRGYHIDHFIFPIGNDLLHVDTMHGTTTKGTHVESNASPKSILDAALKASHEAIRRLATVAPVDVIVVSGNHDELTAHAVGLALDAGFSHTPSVTVDTGHSPRKYRRVGPTALAFHHGDKVKRNRLPGLFLMEGKEVVVGADFFVVYEGHWHGEKGLYQMITDENGVQTRSIPSLCKSDHYHVQHGFGAQRAAELHLLHKTAGPAGIYSVFAHELQTLSAPAALAAD